MSGLSSFPPLRVGECGSLPYPGGSDWHPGTPPGARANLRVSAGDCRLSWELGCSLRRAVGWNLMVPVFLSQNELQNLVWDTEAKIS